MKDLELRLISELMRNSRRSDRDLAKTLKVSQPTVSRTIKRLEKEGYLREYTAVPDFYKIGFDLMSVNFIKLKSETTAEDLRIMRETADELEKQKDLPSLLVMNGMGLGSDRILIMFHKDYTSYSNLVNVIKGKARGTVDKFESFLVSLSDKTHHRTLSLKALAGYLTRMAEEQNREQ